MGTYDQVRETLKEVEVDATCVGSGMACSHSDHDDSLQQLTYMRVSRQRPRCSRRLRRPRRKAEGKDGRHKARTCHSRQTGAGEPEQGRPGRSNGKLEPYDRPGGVRSEFGHLPAERGPWCELTPLILDVSAFLQEERVHEPHQWGALLHVDPQLEQDASAKPAPLRARRIGPRRRPRRWRPPSHPHRHDAAIRRDARCA